MSKTLRETSTEEEIFSSMAVSNVFILNVKVTHKVTFLEYIFN